MHPPKKYILIDYSDLLGKLDLCKDLYYIKAVNKKQMVLINITYRRLTATGSFYLCTHIQIKSLSIQLNLFPHHVTTQFTGTFCTPST